MRSSNNKDLYGVLELPRTASQDDVRRAHRRLARQYHPDANHSADVHSAAERFKEVQNAYEVLSDPEKRREYDEGLRRGRQAAASSTSSTSSSASSSTTSPGSGGDGPGGTGGAGRGGRRNTSRADLSQLVRRLVDLSNHRASRQGEGSIQLQGEDVARLAKHLGVNVSRLSKLLGENISVNAEVSFADARTEGSQAKGVVPPGEASSGPGAKQREKWVKDSSKRSTRKSG